MQQIKSIQSEILRRHQNGETYRVIAADYGVTPATCRRIALGHIPTRPDVLRRLGIPLVNMQIIGDGQITPGAQVISIERTCSCGRKFIPNHPQRKRCFVCSPYRGKK